jgi:hypothetical protein
MNSLFKTPRSLAMTYKSLCASETDVLKMCGNDEEFFEYTSAADVRSDESKNNNVLFK